MVSPDRRRFRAGIESTASTTVNLKCGAGWSVIRGQGGADLRPPPECTLGYPMPSDARRSILHWRGVSLARQEISLGRVSQTCHAPMCMSTSQALSNSKQLPPQGVLTLNTTGRATGTSTRRPRVRRQRIRPRNGSGHARAKLETDEEALAHSGDVVGD